MAIALESSMDTWDPPIASKAVFGRRDLSGVWGELLSKGFRAFLASFRDSIHCHMFLPKRQIRMIRIN